MERLLHRIDAYMDSPVKWRIVLWVAAGIVLIDIEIMVLKWVG
jgi:hypothetical protein